MTVTTPINSGNANNFPTEVQTIAQWLAGLAGLGGGMADDYIGEIDEDAFTETIDLDFSGVTFNGNSARLTADLTSITTRPIITPSANPIDADNEDVTLEFLFLDGDGANLAADTHDGLKIYACNIYDFTYLFAANNTRTIEFVNCYIDDGLRLVKDDSGSEDGIANFYYNTIYDIDFGFGLSSANFEINWLNNIFQTVNSTQRLCDADNSDSFSTGGGEATNNCYYFDGSAKYSDTFSSLVAFKAQHPSEENSSQENDPACDDLTSNDFDIPITSPCLEAATDLYSLGHDTDWYDNTRDPSTPDVGCMESIVGTLPSSVDAVYPANPSTPGYLYPADQRTYFAFPGSEEPVEDGTVQYRVELRLDATDGDEYICLDSWANGEWYGGSLVSPKGENYTIGGSDTLEIMVDGGAAQTVTFVGTETTAQNVVDAINAQTTDCTASAVDFYNYDGTVVDTGVRIQSDDTVSGSIRVSGGTVIDEFGFQDWYTATYDSGDATNYVDFDLSTDYTPGVGNDPDTVGTWNPLGTGDPGPGGSEPANGTDATPATTRYVRCLLPNLPYNRQWYCTVLAYTGERG